MSETRPYSDSVQILPALKFNVLAIEDFVALMELDYSQTFKINCYSLIFITSGQTQYVVDFKVYDLKEGDVLLLSPGQVFYCLTPRRVKGKMIYLMEEFFHVNSEQDFVVGNYSLLMILCQKGKLTISSDRKPNFYCLIDLITSEVETFKDRPSIILQQLISVLLNSLEREYSRLERNEIFIAEKNLALKFKVLVEKDLSVKNNVEYFCSKLKISKSTLQKATKLVFQKTPKDIIEEVLLLEAKRLLKVSNLHIQEVGYNLGFTDPTNFTKFFKRNTGLTPNNFRKKKFD